MPPDISAFEPTYLPNSLPKQMPAAENKKVINPISHEASMIGTFSIDIDTPTASASMLVATARVNIVRTHMSQSTLSSFLPNIMLIPIYAKIANAIQWSRNER